MDAHVSAYEKIMNECMGVWLQYTTKEFHSEPKFSFAFSREVMKEWGAAYKPLFPAALLTPEDQIEIYALGKKSHLSQAPEKIARLCCETIKDALNKNYGTAGRMEDQQKAFLASLLNMQPTQKPSDMSPA